MTPVRSDIKETPAGVSPGRQNAIPVPDLLPGQLSVFFCELQTLSLPPSDRSHFDPFFRLESS